jgi:putative salt-induced outer membrane protein
MKRIHTPLYLLAGLIVATGSAHAQIKTDGLWRGSGGLALSATSGNNRSNSLQLNADAVRATAADKITFGAAANYASNKNSGAKQTTSNKWGLFGQYDFNLTPRLFAFGRLGLDGDELIDLNLRTGVAAGLGYKLIDTKETSFELFGGVGYTTDKYDVAQTVGNKTDTKFSRTSLYLGEASSHQLSATTSFKQRLDLYPGLTGDKAKLAKFTAGLTVAMSSTLGLSVGVVDTYNSKPPVGVKKNDFGVFTGVTVKFGAV